MTGKSFPFDQTGQKVGVQININASSDDDELILYHLIDLDANRVIAGRSLTVDEAYARNKAFLANKESYRWKESHD